MKKYLLFTLSGPLAAWGRDGVHLNRLVYTAPSKSAVIGLIAGCMGIKRDDSTLVERFENIKFSVLQIYQRSKILDYHTISLPKTKGLPTRLDEIYNPPNDNSNQTIVSQREYIVGNLSVVAISDETLYLEEVAHYLNFPIFTPYLGRKCCVLSQPMNPSVIEKEDDVVEALKEYMSTIPVKIKQEKYKLYTEEVLDDENYIIHSRYDQPTDKNTWTFKSRQEYIVDI